MIEVQEKIGFRSLLGVPLLREGSPIGVIALLRTALRPFSDREIELVTTFADQAVIAIENVRLFDEVQKRTDDLAESLAHQTAASEVLSVISRSPTSVQPVFDAIVESAARLCGALFSVIWLYDGELLHYVASHNFHTRGSQSYFQNVPEAARSLAECRSCDIGWEDCSSTRHAGRPSV